MRALAGHYEAEVVPVWKLRRTDFWTFLYINGVHWLRTYFPRKALQREQEELRNKACGKIHFVLDFSRLWATTHIPQKYVNIPSEKYIYVHIYVCICVYTYLCKMDERWSYASLSKKWMSTGLMLACHKNGWVPVLCWLVIKMDEYRSYAGLS